MACKKLADLQNGDKKLTVFGVVRMFRPPALTSNGRNYSCTVELWDETLGSGPSSGGKGITCVMFARQADVLPKECLPGDVVILRKMNVVLFNNRLQGNLYDYGSCSVFDGHVTAVIEPRGGAGSAGLPMPKAEVKRVEELKQWAVTNHLSSDDLLQSAGGSGATSLPTPLSHSIDSPPRKIASLGEGDKRVTVSGVVRYFKPPTKCRGNNSHHVTISVIDDSLETLTAVVFNTDERRLPRMCSPGDVVLIRGLYVLVYDEQLQGKGHEHTSSVLCFSGQQDAPLRPKDDHPFVMTTQEEESVRELKKWASSQVGLWPQGYTCPLKDVKEGNFFDISCQVSAISHDPRESSYVLTMWDGTMLSFPCAKANTTNHFVDFDPGVRYASRGLTQDVFVSGGGEIKVRVGDFVYLVNVHVASFPRSSQSLPQSQGDGLPNKLLLLMDPPHNGAIGTLKEGDMEVAELKKQLPPLPEPTPKWRRLKKVLPSTVTVQLSPEDKKTASVSTILSYSRAPVRFATQVKVLRVASPSSVEEMCQLRCPVCKSRAPAPQQNQTTAAGLKVGDKCTRCVLYGDNARSQSRFEFVYVFSLRVKDESGEMVVHVSDTDAKTLFPKLPPANLHVDSEAREGVLNKLFLFTGGNDPFFDIPEEYCLPRPWMQCCVLLCVSKAKNLCYRVFDTVCVS